MRKLGYKRSADATFDLNLAPILDIIVAIVPMLLLSVAFIQVKMIETPVPLVTQNQVPNKDEPPKVSMTLKASKTQGFWYTITDKGQKKDVKVALKNGQFDYEALTTSTIQIKRQYPDVFQLDFSPEGNVAFDDLVKTMDSVRRLPASEPKISFIDAKTGQKAETDLLFSEVVFGNVLEMKE